MICEHKDGSVRAAALDASLERLGLAAVGRRTVPFVYEAVLRKTDDSSSGRESDAETPRAAEELTA
jgi:hypothetical protein